ncbi:hypothetical protein PAXINDRAFT_100258 [Paxillus involutus ATCC 200175]|uniref:DUF6533 domain-containing protein n=1 Tax=Paxillus involutus ATCC 200175 TaxID=664439 RepID=A0A0C9U4B2_PAXIN|nr:hypothetical protein PAXINDRAFT_100258 [Paxillus involutus ATCC 200175]
MEASLSPDTIAALASLQTRNYIYVSIAAFWTYGYCLKWSAEYTYVFCTPWRLFKLLYLIARYSPFFLLGFHLYLNLLPNESEGTCNFVDNICSMFTALSIISAESIFISRTWALWGRSKKILRLILVPFALILAFDIVVSVGIEQPSQIAAVPPAARGSLTGCYTLHHDNLQIIPFVLIVVFELEVLLLTCIRAIKVYRERKGGLVQIIFQHNIFYFSCGLVFSCINVVAILFLKYNYATMFQDFQIVMHSVLVTNMHLALWSRERIELDTPQVLAMTTLTQAEFVTPTTLTWA